MSLGIPINAVAVAVGAKNRNSQFNCKFTLINDIICKGDSYFNSLEATVQKIKIRNLTLNSSLMVHL